jgi:hypothetical protein
MLSSLNFANKQLPLINDWSCHLEQFTLNKSKTVDYLDLINTMTANKASLVIYQHRYFYLKFFS